jgi:hypothetical protein
LSQANVRYVDVALTDLQRVPSGPIQPAVSDTTTQSLICTTSCRPRWRHRLFARCSTRARDVPPTVSNRRLSIMPRKALQSPHQDPPRGTQTTYRMRAGRYWPVKATMQPERAAVQEVLPTCAYSSRSASTGLTRSARLAGATNAATDVARTMATTPSKVTGSRGLTP